jgi:hypothetical protein
MAELDFGSMPPEVLAEVLGDAHPATVLFLIEAAPPPGLSAEERAGHWQAHAAGMFSKWMKEKKDG